MILEFRFQEEFHLCSNVPDNLTALRFFLRGTFKSELPEDFKLEYTVPNQNELKTVQTEEDYQRLITQDATEAIQVSIVAAAPKVAESEERKVSDPVQPSVDNQNPNEPNKYPYFSYMSPQDEHIRKVVRETLQEQLPYVISQVRAALVKEFNLGAPQQRVQAPIQQAIRIEREDSEESKNQGNAGVQVLDREPGSEIVRKEAKNESLVDKIGKAGIFEQVKKFGSSVKDQVSEFGGKAIDAVDNLSQKVAGDPYVDIEEGRYLESVVKKANSLKEIFPEEEKKALLEFVKRYARNVTLEQLANVYLMKDEPQAELLENNARPQNENQNQQQAGGIIEPL